MAVLAAIIAREAHLDSRESRLIRETLSARLLAESGVRLALDRLPTGARFPIACDLEAGRIWAEIRPVASLIDVNTSQEETLAALFAVSGATGPEATAMAAKIADFRDGDATPRPGGAEAADYQRAGLPHGPANRPLTRLGELSEVLGLDRQILLAALPHLTVHSHSPRVDLTYATPEVTAALRDFGGGWDVDPDIDQIDLTADHSGQRISEGPVVIRVVATTPGGQRHMIAATYGVTRSGSGSGRRLVEEHPADINLDLSRASAPQDTGPCFGR
jgi:hypothetical protein